MAEADTEAVEATEGEAAAIEAEAEALEVVIAAVATATLHPCTTSRNLRLCAPGATLFR